MKHFKILVHVWFTTIKVVYDIKYKKHFIRITSRVAERIRKLGNIGKSQKCVEAEPSTQSLF